MPVIIGELGVVAAPPPSEPGPDGVQQPQPLSALDVVRITERDRQRRARSEAD
jgi:hypothetical protein